MDFVQRLKPNCESIEASKDMPRNHLAPALVDSNEGGVAVLAETAGRA